MNDDGVLDIVTAMLDIDPDAADRDELGVLVGLNSRLKAFSALVDLRCSRRADQLAARGASESGFVLLLSECKSGQDAKHAQDRDRVCSDLPEFETALVDGAVSGEHLDVLAKHTKGLTDQERCELQAVIDDLVASAAADSASLFERTTKKVIAGIKARTSATSDVEELDRQRQASSMKRWTDRETGLKMTLLALDPMRDLAFHSVIDAQLAVLRQDPANARVPFEQLKINAVLAAVSERAGELRIPEVVLHLDATSACDGRHDHTLSETIDGEPIPVATVQRMCCEAILTAVLVEADGTVTNLAEQRTANRHQRRALAAMYSTCAHPHCQVGFSNCRMHHIVWWTNGGPTILVNLLPLCETHHHLVHEGGWNLTMTPDREVTWHRPDGTIWQTHHSPNRQPRQADRHDERRNRQRCRTSDAEPTPAEPARQSTLC